MENDVLAELSRLDLRNLDTPASAVITAVQHLASYNWIEAPKATPTIVVPGSPDLWSPPNAISRLKKDSGHVYIAQNAARHPESPLEPLFRALYFLHPSFDIAGIDIVTDRNNLRKLLGVVNPRWNGFKMEDFNIQVEVRETTAIFCRTETKTEEYIGPNEFRGYGHTFEKHYTRREIAGSTGHHRILSYNLGGLKLLVRHETDGYIGAPRTESNLLSTGNGASGVDELSEVLDSLTLSSNQNMCNNISGSNLVIRKEGQTIPLTSTLEIKTRVAHRPLVFEDVVAQLWISQTPKLVRAYHTNGVFAFPHVEDVVANVKAWQYENQEDLKLFAGLITRIRDVVKGAGGQIILKYNSKEDCLSFSRSRGAQMLPEDVYARWDKKSNVLEVENEHLSVTVANSPVADKTPEAAKSQSVVAGAWLSM
jgi:hypothetical protein